MSRLFLAPALLYWYIQRAGGTCLARPPRLCPLAPPLSARRASARASARSPLRRSLSWVVRAGHSSVLGLRCPRLVRRARRSLAGCPRFARRLSSSRSPVVLVSLARPLSPIAARAVRSPVVPGSPAWFSSFPQSGTPPRLVPGSQFPCLVLVLSSVRYSSSSRARFPVTLPGSRPPLSPVLLLVLCPVPGSLHRSRLGSCPWHGPVSPRRSRPGSRPCLTATRSLAVPVPLQEDNSSSTFGDRNHCARGPTKFFPQPTTGRRPAGGCRGAGGTAVRSTPTARWIDSRCSHPSSSPMRKRRPVYWRVSAALRVTGQREVVQYDGRSGEEDIDGEMAVGRPAARTIASKT